MITFDTSDTDRYLRNMYYMHVRHHSLSYSIMKNNRIIKKPTAYIKKNKRYKRCMMIRFDTSDINKYIANLDTKWAENESSAVLHTGKIRRIHYLFLMLAKLSIVHKASYAYFSR